MSDQIQPIQSDQQIQPELNKQSLDSSESISSSSDDEISFDILSNQTKSIKSEYIITVNKESHESTENEEKVNCRILKFHPEWKHEDLLSQIRELDPKVYKYLFIVIVTLQNIEQTVDCAKLIEILEKFSIERPMILQITYEEQKLTKFYYKTINISSFQESIFTSVTDFSDFSTFMWMFLKGKFESFEQLIIDKLPAVDDSSLIYRFIKILDIHDKYDNGIVLECAAEGSENDLKSAINFPFYDNNEELCDDVKKYLTLDTRRNDENDSILSNAISNKNTLVYEFLIQTCARMVSKFQYDFQIEISTLAFSVNQLNFLCKLVDVCDFPFPKDIDMKSVSYEEFAKIIEERVKFSEAIAANKTEDIDSFFETHPNHKFIFSPENCSALHQAVSAKRIQLLKYLLSKGLISPEYHSYQATIKDEKSKSINRELAMQIRKNNVDTAVPNFHNIALLLSSRSLIHNKNLSKEVENQYRSKIQKWFKDIFEIEADRPHLETAVQCEDLKIIFDFESYEIINIDVISKNSSGISYPLNNWIFIGAKYNDKDELRDKKIEGVMIHEISHYTMELRYENHSKPYYFHDKKAEEKFEEVVKETKEFSTDGPDDGCNGIISSVFKKYPRERQHAELIVRVPQILTEFRDDNDKLKNLEKKYLSLFNFHKDKILTDLKKFNFKDRESVRNLNKIAGLLPQIQNLEFEFSVDKNTSSLSQNKLNVISTNVPLLLFLNIFIKLKEKFSKLTDAKNIFIASENFKNDEIYWKFDAITKNSNLSVFADFTKDIDDDIISSSSQNLTLIISDKTKRDELIKRLKRKKLAYSEFQVDYNWSNLTAETQQELLMNKVKFQEKYRKIFALITDPNENDLPTIADIELLNMLLEQKPILVNSKNEKIDKNFKILFQTRVFLKKISNQIVSMSIEDLLEDVKEKLHVIISDGAGTGKSWIMSNLEDVLRIKYPEKWTTYIDLKEFIDQFKPVTETKPEFSKFIADEILSRRLKMFEAEIFEKMYENGRTIILFDGFDEIAPDCTNFVNNLIKSFKSNGGNQLWTVTRDYFEDDLKSLVGNGDVYKLKPFEEEDGIKLIVSTWMLNDLGVNFRLPAGKKFEDLMKDYENYENYQQHATELYKEISKITENTIGSPLFYKMTAEVVKINKSITTELTIFKVFREFVRIHIKRWSDEKGSIRKAANIEMQISFVIDFRGLHQFFAMHGYYPDVENFNGLKFEGSNWPEHEIIACGLLTKKSENFFFLHETFREYFAADFVVSTFAKDMITDDFFGYLTNFLTLEHFIVVRMFLDEAFYEDSMKIAIERNLQKLADLFLQNIDKFEDLWRVFNENRPNLVEFLIKIFKLVNSRKVFNFLQKFHKILQESSRHTEICFKMFDFLAAFFDKNDMTKLIVYQPENDYNYAYHLVINADADPIQRIFERIREHLGEAVYKKILTTPPYQNSNIIQRVVIGSTNLKVNQVVWKLRRECCRSNKEFLKLLTDANNIKENVFRRISHFSTSEIYNFLIEQLEECATRDEIREIFRTSGYTNSNMLFTTSAFNASKGIRNKTWKIARKYFSFEEILKMTTESTMPGRSLMHSTVLWKGFEAIKGTWNDIERNVSELCAGEEHSRKESILEEIIKMKDESGVSVIYMAAWYSKSLESHQFLWELARNYCKSDKEFFEYFINVEPNIFLMLVQWIKDVEILNFMISTLEQITTKDKIKILLSGINADGYNILQTLAWKNVRKLIHNAVWDLIDDYFDEFEIIEMIKHKNKACDNHFHIAVMGCSEDIIQLTWEKISKFLSEIECQVEFLKELGSDGLNLRQKYMKNQGKRRIEYFDELLLQYGVELSENHLHTGVKEFFLQIPSFLYNYFKK